MAHGDYNLWHNIAIPFDFVGGGDFYFSPVSMTIVRVAHLVEGWEPFQNSVIYKAGFGRDILIKCKNYFVTILAVYFHG